MTDCLRIMKCNLQSVSYNLSSFKICWYLSRPCRLVDEALTSSVLGIKEGAKIQGLQAAVTGAAASLIAQAVTTPVLCKLPVFRCLLLYFVGSLQGIVWNRLFPLP